MFSIFTIHAPCTAQLAPAKMPCTTHAPIPCTAQLARQPNPKSDPTKARDT